jgi:hypothetical protein
VRLADEDVFEEEEGDDAHDGGTPAERHWYFHLVMAMGSMYSAMLLTNWGTESGDSTSVESLWIKLATNWLTYALYLWTMVAPLALKGRNFNDAHNQFR